MKRNYNCVGSDDKKYCRQCKCLRLLSNCAKISVIFRDVSAFVFDVSSAIAAVGTFI